MTVDAAPTFDAAQFRSVLGHFCTGVTVVTAHDGERPVGFACQSFAALSLDPPLILFCPAKSSGTWPIIERVGRFAVNVLSDDQRELSTVFGSLGADKFASVDWVAAPSGAPLLEDPLTWVDCLVETVHEAGDHYVVVGRVTELGGLGSARPLLFYRGSYAATERDTLAPVRDGLRALLTWPRPDDWF